MSEEFLEDIGETTKDAPPGGEGGGGADDDESFTLGGPRGRDAEREEYYKPDEDGV